jgi:hypothetical protein
MESYQSIVLAECIAKDRRERAQRAAEQWSQAEQGVPQAGLREAMAGMLIGLAQRLAPQHAALGIQHR